MSVPYPKGDAGKRKRERAKQRKAKKYGSAKYIEAIHASGCVVARLAATPQTPCSGYITFSHLEKSNRERHGWRRAVGMCFHHHLNEFEGKVADFCKDNGLPFAILEAEAQRLVEEFGHLVP